jgi:predicted O-methyltransferase YrrM
MCAIVRAMKPKTLLETGTYRGLTTTKLAQAMPKDATLWTVDSGDAGGNPEFGTQNIHYVKSDIMAFLRDTKLTFDFAFVDDDHSYDHVWHEIELLRPLMAPHGVICMHDVYAPGWRLALGEVCHAFGGINLKLPLLGPLGGLGIIQL